MRQIMAKLKAKLKPEPPHPDDWMFLVEEEIQETGDPLTLQWVMQANCDGNRLRFIWFNYMTLKAAENDTYWRCQGVEYAIVLPCQALKARLLKLDKKYALLRNECGDKQAYWRQTQAIGAVATEVILRTAVLRQTKTILAT